MEDRDKATYSFIMDQYGTEPLSPRDFATNEGGTHSTEPLSPRNKVSNEGPHSTKHLPPRNAVTNGELSVHFVRKLEDFIVDKIHGTATFECELSHDVVTVKWFHDKEVLKPGGKYRIDDRGLVHRLEIFDIDGEDAGKYMVIAKGQTSTAELFVEYVYTYAPGIKQYTDVCRLQFQELIGRCRNGKDTAGLDLPRGLVFKDHMVSGLVLQGHGYKYKGFVGSGYFGKVNKAVDVTTGAVHVIKKIEINDFSPGEILALYELERLGVVPAILLVQLDVGRRVVLIHLEYLDGITINKLVENKSSPTMLEEIRNQHGPCVHRKLSWKIFRDMLLALKRLHSLSWVHNDVSGHNVMIVDKSFHAESSSMCVRLDIYFIDFGEAYKPPDDEGIDGDLFSALRIFVLLCCIECGVKTSSKGPSRDEELWEELMVKLTKTGDLNLVKCLENSRKLLANRETNIEEFVKEWSFHFQDLTGPEAASIKGILFSTSEENIAPDLPSPKLF